MRASDTSWIQSLAEGDTVIVYHFGSVRGWRKVEKVTRMTPTQVVVNSGRFRKDNGRMVGGHYSACLLEATPDAVAKLRDDAEATRLRRSIQGVRWDAVPLETLRSVAHLLVRAGLTGCGR